MTDERGANTSGTPTALSPDGSTRNWFTTASRFGAALWQVLGELRVCDERRHGALATRIRPADGAMEALVVASELRSCSQGDLPIPGSALDTSE